MIEWNLICVTFLIHLRVKPRLWRCLLMCLEATLRSGFYVRHLCWGCFVHSFFAHEASSKGFQSVLYWRCMRVCLTLFWSDAIFLHAMSHIVNTLQNPRHDCFSFGSNATTGFWKVVPSTHISSLLKVWFMCLCNCHRVLCRSKHPCYLSPWIHLRNCNTWAVSYDFRHWDWTVCSVGFQWRSLVCTAALILSLGLFGLDLARAM